MSLAFRLSLTDQVSPTGRALAGALAPKQLFPVIGRSAVGTFRKHLFEVNRTRPNALGGTRTGFYASAARGTSFETTGDGVTLTVASVGIRQRLLPRRSLIPCRPTFSGDFDSLQLGKACQA